MFGQGWSLVDIGDTCDTEVLTLPPLFQTSTIRILQQVIIT